MEEIDNISQNVFNGHLETGVRAVVLLDALYPKGYDLTHLIWFDHLVVHTHDFSGPPSLHPDIPQRTGELVVRRRLIEESLKLMARLHLITIGCNERGIAYTASDEAPAFIENLRAVYSRDLKQRARWLAEYLTTISDQDLEKMINSKIGKWAIEFQGSYHPGKTKDGI